MKKLISAVGSIIFMITLSVLALLYLVLLIPLSVFPRFRAVWIVNFKDARRYLRISRGRRLLRHANDSVTADRAHDAAAMLERARKSITAAGGDNTKELARYHHVSGLAYERIGSPEQVISEYAKAESLLAGDGGDDSRELAHLRGDFARYLESIGDRRRRDEVLGAMRKYNHQDQVRDGFDAVQVDVLLGEEKFDEAIELLGRLRAGAIRKGNDDLTHRLTMLIATCRLANHEAKGVPVDLAEIRRTIEETDRFFVAKNMRDGHVQALIDLARVHRLEGLPGRALPIIEQAIEISPIRGPGTVEGKLAMGQEKVAILLLLDQREALRAALEMVTVIDAQRYALNGHQLRAAWASESLPMWGAAMHIACLLGEHEIVAELIESARLQATPSAVADIDTPANRSERLHDSKLDERAFISVRGQSRLAATHQSTLGAPGRLDIVPLEDTMSGIDDAIWWGTWLAGSRLFWATLDKNGTCRSGMSEESGIEDIGSLIVLMSIETSQVKETGSLGRLTFEHSSLMSDPSEEEEIMRKVGMTFLPEELRAAIRWRATERLLGNDAPLQLLAALSPQIAEFPIALLAVEDVENPYRVMEGAVVRHLPPARVAVRARRAVASLSLPVESVLAVVDPTGDLAYARAAPPGARTILRGDRRDDPEPPESRATRSNVVRAMREAGKSTLFYYSGHFGMRDANDALSSGLVLQDGILRAGDILRSRRDEDVYPGRALLGACSSFSDAGLGAGEWLGFTAAMLLVGCGEIVGTAWTLLDHPETRKIEHEIAGMLATEKDHAAGLRRIQLECLALWRTNKESERDGVRSLPIIWAAYQAIG